MSADRARATGDDPKYDLLTAALLGLAVGAGIALLVRRGPSGSRPLESVLAHTGKGLKWSSRMAARYGKRGGRWLADAGEEAWDRIPHDEIREAIGERAESAKDAVDDLLESGMRNFERAIRKRRRALGI